MEQSPFVPSKRARTPNNGSQIVCCTVDGCSSDLSKCREYHRRHKVCELHSKTPKVTVRGEEQRFCQQCSRFHYLVEFDDAKRSCRKRLDGHNRRRRKPNPDTSSQTATSQFLPNYEVSPHEAFLSRSSCCWSVPKTPDNRVDCLLKKAPSFSSFGGASQIQFPFFQEKGITSIQQQQVAPFPFVGARSDRALSLLSSPESSCSHKLIAPSSLLDATTATATVLVSQGMMFPITREEEDESNQQQQATSFSWN